MNMHTPDGTTRYWLPLALLLAAGWVSSAVPGIAAAATPAGDASRWQDHAAIRTAAEEAARQAIHGAASLTADRPDPRLRLARCSEPLAATVPPNGVGSARITVEVRCTGSQPWSLYLPVQVTATQAVVVAARSLARDTVLAPRDIRLADPVAGSSPTGALHDPADVVGRRLKRPVNEGQALTAGLLAAATVIQRGQEVSVEAHSGALQVRMAGIAREDGALGDIINVESKTSGRVVQGIVRSPQTVEVMLR